MARKISEKTILKKVNSNLLVVFLTFIGISFLLYGNTLFNSYCLDDAIVITENSFTKQGLSGIGDIFANESFTGFFGKDKQLVSGGRYRPLSIASFAMEYQFFGANPSISHFVNILLYGLTGFLVFLVLSMLFRNRNEEKWYLQLPFIIAALYMFHPVHTEVVANIKGRDEIFALLFGLLAFWQVLKYTDNANFKHLIFSTVFLFLALLSKEHALVFFILIPFALLLFKNNSLKQVLKITGILLIPSILFLAIRQEVLGQVVLSNVSELMNNSFLNANSDQRFATISYTLVKYLQLLVFPHPLTYDYYPYHIQLTNWSNIVSVLSVITYAFLGIWGLISLKKNPIYSFSIAVFVLPLIPVANIFFPIGTFMSERFIYIPSLGFCIIIGYLIYSGIHSKIRYYRILTLSLIAILVIWFGVKTISRNAVWKNDFTLFTTDVKTSINSAKGNCAAGGILLDTFKDNPDQQVKDMNLKLAIGYLNKAVAIHPTYIDAWLLLGNAYLNFRDSADLSVSCYEEILKFSPQNEKAIHNLEFVANNEKVPAKKVKLFENVLKYEPKSYAILYQLGNIWGKELANLALATKYLEKALEVNPTGKEALKDLGVAYAMQQNFRKSADIMEQVVKIDSTDANVWNNLGLTYANLKELEKANRCFQKAKSLQQVQGKKN